MLRRFLKVLLALLAVAALLVAFVVVRRISSIPPAGPTGVATPGTWTYKFDFGGTERSYVLHVPTGLDSGTPVPLLIELHGGGGSGDSIDGLTGFFALADREGFVVAAPSGIGKAWNDGREEKAGATGGADDVGFLAAAIDRIESQASIDARRVYVTGMSNGAIMSGRLACQLSDRIAAVAQVAGTAAVSVAGSCDPGRAVPILEIHGTADPLVPYGGGTVASMLGGRGDVVSVDDWAAAWVARNGDDATPAGDDHRIGHDRPDVARRHSPIRRGVLSGEWRRTHVAGRLAVPAPFHHRPDERQLRRLRGDLGLPFGPHTGLRSVEARAPAPVDGTDRRVHRGRLAASPGD